MHSITFASRVDFDLDTPAGLEQAKNLTTEAIDVARIYLNALDEPYEIDEIHTRDRLMVDIHFRGQCAGSEPLGLTWSRDMDPPHDWMAFGAVKPHGAQDPFRAHVVVAQIVKAWQDRGLITESNDEYGYMDAFSETRLRTIYGLDEFTPRQEALLDRLRDIHVPHDPKLFEAAAHGRL